jgi:hypothetical protein
MLELRSDRVVEALPLFERAAMLAPEDGSIQAALGLALVEQFGSRGGTRDAGDDSLQKARMALTRAVTLEPGVATTQALLGYVERVIGIEMPRAVRALEEAVRLAPAREQYRLMLADALIAQRDFEKASAQLGPLMARSKDASIRTSARALLVRIADDRNRELTPNGAAARTAPPIAPPPPGVAPSSAGAPAGAPPTMVLDLRPLKAGETREPGVFRSIECRAGAVVLVIARDSGPLRVTAKAFADIEFITYRSNTGGSVACGVLEKPEPVLVTYRRDSTGAAPSDADGVAIAIELVPDNYVFR